MSIDGETGNLYERELSFSRIIVSMSTRGIPRKVPVPMISTGCGSSIIFFHVDTISFFEREPLSAKVYFSMPRGKSSAILFISSVSGKQQKMDFPLAKD